jgi:hypothetical protein
MARQELHSDMLPPIEQPPPIGDRRPDEGTIVTGEKIGGNTDYLDELQFMEEPVTIRLEPSSERNAPNAHPVWVNGKAAEVFVGGRWREIGYLPVGQLLTVRRSVLEVIARSKTDDVTTEYNEREDPERVRNRVMAVPRAVYSFSVISDPNPRGPAWLAEMRRRYF